MNKSKLLVVVGMVMAISFQSCKNNTPPSNPKDGQEYRDDRDNLWTWNQAMGCWMIMSAMNNSGGGTSHYHYYYPSSNRWTNSSGITTSAPSYVSTKTTSAVNKKFTEKSYKSNSSSSVKSSTSTTKKGSGIDLTKKSPANSSKPKSGGFGSSFKPSHS